MNSERKIYKTADLCCGIGGMRRGFEMTGRFKNVLSAEIDEQACKTYLHLFGDDPHNDLMSDDFIAQVDCSDYEILLAGFPCQAFSAVGNEQGFNDKTRGTVFFHIARAMTHHRPQAILLENVENLVRHQQGCTFRIILEKLENELNYRVVGVSRDENGKLLYDWHDFIRNSRNFGIPQNRPRTYIVAFDGDRFEAEQLAALPKRIPDHRDEVVYETLDDLLELGAPAEYYMASGYLETLKRHKVRQKKKGSGYGYKVVNDPSKKNHCANTILATGGSGKERNLVYDPQKGIEGMLIPTKKTPLNGEGLRFMTPREWGKLQGFIGYGFMETGTDTFSFPDKTPKTQQYKQFGNSVTIPVIRTMAEFIADCLDKLNCLDKSSSGIVENYKNE